MPFVKFKMDEAVHGGSQARRQLAPPRGLQRTARALRAHLKCCPPSQQVLDVKLPFDEQQLLRNNTPYLLRSLDLSSLRVHSIDNLAAAAAVRVNVSGAYPAAPVVVFAAAPPEAAAAVEGAPKHAAV